MLLEVRLIYVNATGFHCFCFTGMRLLRQAVPSPLANTAFTQLTTQLVHHGQGDGVCTHVHVSADFPECVCDTGGTVDKELLRGRLAVLLCADIRASMSSSSSENSCGRQR